MISSLELWAEDALWWSGPSLRSLSLSL
jgi:hypothetical protein